MRRTSGKSILSTSVAAVGLVVGAGAPPALAQSPAGPYYYYYPAPGAVGGSPGYSYEPAPTSAGPTPGYYYYPPQAYAGHPGGYYYYPGPGYVTPPQGRYYYYPAPVPGPAYAAPPAESAHSPAPAMRRGWFGFPRPVYPVPRPGDDDDYAYKS